MRLWFLGEKAAVNYSGGDGRHCNAAKYWEFLTEAWRGLSPLLEQKARLVIRIGGRRLTRDEIKSKLTQSLEEGLKKSVHLTDDGIASTAKHSQANAFRGSKAEPTVEYDFCFLVGSACER